MSNNSKSSNNPVVPEAREALDRFKMEAASEVGVNLKQGYNGDLTSREAGSVGGQMVKKMIEAYENSMKEPFPISYEETAAGIRGGLFLFGLSKFLFGKNRLDHAPGSGRRIAPHIQMPSMEKVFRHDLCAAASGCVKRIDNDELHLHLLRDEVFDIDTGLLPGEDVLLRFGQTGQIRCELDENPIILHTAHNSRHRGPAGKPHGVFLPCP